MVTVSDHFDMQERSVYIPGLQTSSCVTLGDLFCLFVAAVLFFSVLLVCLLCPPENEALTPVRVLRSECGEYKCASLSILFKGTAIVNLYLSWKKLSKAQI